MTKTFNNTGPVGISKAPLAEKEDMINLPEQQMDSPVKTLTQGATEEKPQVETEVSAT